jgi:hypothetical protein
LVPSHTEGAFTVTVGTDLIVTVAIAVFEQPSAVPVTVYVVVEVGETEILFPAAPLLHK